MPEASLTSHHRYCSGAVRVIRPVAQPVALRAGNTTGPTISKSPLSWTITPPCSASTRRAPAGPSSSAIFERVSASSALSAKRRRGDQPAPDGRSCARVEQMMGVGAVGAPPDADVQAGRRDAAASDLDRADRVQRQGMLDIDLVRLELRADPTDGDVASAVDDEPGVAREPERDRVGTQPLARPAGVDHHPGRPGDRARLVVDYDPAPPRGRVGPSRAARRRLRQRLLQRGRLDSVERVVVPDALEGSYQRRVDESAAAARRPEPGTDRGAEQPRGPRRTRAGRG